MYEEFNRLNVGDVIQLDQMNYTFGVNASGSMVMIGQHGDQNDEYEYYEAVEHQAAEPDEYPRVKIDFGFDARPLPTNRIGENAEKLAGKKFVVVSARPDGVPEEEMHHSVLENSPSGQIIFADEVFINDHDELYMEGEFVCLRIGFYQGQGYDHSYNFPTVIGNAPVQRTYTVGNFTPKPIKP